MCRWTAVLTSLRALKEWFFGEWQEVNYLQEIKELDHSGCKGALIETRQSKVKKRGRRKTNVLSWGVAGIINLIFQTNKWSDKLSNIRVTENLLCADHWFSSICCRRSTGMLINHILPHLWLPKLPPLVLETGTRLGSQNRVSVHLPGCLQGNGRFVKIKVFKFDGRSQCLLHRVYCTVL